MVRKDPIFEARTNVKVRIPSTITCHSGAMCLITSIPNPAAFKPPKERSRPGGSDIQVR
ncbi:hypothetical protein AOCH_007325, partial [Aspergillus ochraceoroseus]